MRLGLEPKLTQSLKIAPQLIQSLKMLQMPVLKLEQMLRHELSVNPLLEEIETQDQDQEQEQIDEREAELVGENVSSNQPGKRVTICPISISAARYHSTSTCWNN